MDVSLTLAELFELVGRKEAELHWTRRQLQMAREQIEALLPKAPIEEPKQ